MGKKPYYKTSGLGGGFIAILIGIFGMIGFFISNYGFLLIPIFFAIYLYIKFSDNTESKTEMKTVKSEPTESTELNKKNEFDKTSIQKEKSELISDEELFGIDKMLSVVGTYDKNIIVHLFRITFLEDKKIKVDAKITTNEEIANFEVSKSYNSIEELNDDIKKKVLNLCSI
ncbi:hypothetical protein [Tenacibaculum maritimum]|uniref:hypothetical protein n=1 Tax=Tenacibaculum maritimum TaxID=107401 RepID=UPI001330A545|nr:hypothetical protein [Tenacibaculum maritimum]